jgi:hypothetical protein
VSRRQAPDDEEMVLDTRSTVTTRVRRQRPDRPHGPDSHEADLDTRSTRTVRTVRRSATKPTDDHGAGDA